MLAIWPIATSTYLLEKTIMRNYVRLTFALVLLCAAMTTASFASSMYIVQGIAGRNYAADTNPAFPVDVLLNDEVCYVHGLAFGNIQGPLTFFPGSYDVKVSIANTLAPCSNSPLIDTTVKIGPERDISAVIALDSMGTPTLVTFTNNLTPVPANETRLLFAQTVSSTTVQVVVENVSTKKLYTYNVKPGALLDANLPAGAYTVSVSQGKTTLVESTAEFLDSQSVTLLHAIGQASNSTVVLASKVLRDVT